MAEQTFERDDVKSATLQLIAENAKHLIQHVYDHTDTYSDPVVRVGLVLKILLKSGKETQTVDAEVIEPAMEDLTQLINNTEDVSQKSIYSEELRFLKHCTFYNDLITLNTAMQKEQSALA